MEADYFLVFGLIIGALSIPSIIGAFSADRSLRPAVILIAIGTAMIAYAASQKPGGYSGAEIPQVFQRVILDIVN